MECFRWDLLKFNDMRNGQMQRLLFTLKIRIKRNYSTWRFLFPRRTISMQLVNFLTSRSFKHPKIVDIFLSVNYPSAIDNRNDWVEPTVCEPSILIYLL
ncbi:uncharacterized protein CANTADRAFT_26101, partial [Suhomyces tanzawaensis NRRL Y-17324]